MAIRYSAEFLLHLRDSPLCIRPPNLPPLEDWMGSLESTRTQNVKLGGDRTRTNDSSLLDPTSRRPLDRNISRNSANPDDIVFGPPRIAFSSARGNKTTESDKSSRDADTSGRTGTRNRSDGDGDRFRESRSNTLRRRVEVDSDGDGWSTVKPRKSFGAEGADRFHGKMGGSFREERRSARDGKDDRDAGMRERANRPLETFPRDRENPDVDGRPRNGMSSRNKADNWRTSEAAEAAAPEKRERDRDRDRTKSWRERDRDADPSDDRNAVKTTDRRWGRDRDQRPERDPEWMDEPAEAREAHTQQDFQKWMEKMKKAKIESSSSTAKPAAEPSTESAKSALPAPSVETGPDKFFLAFGGGDSSIEAATPGEKEASMKPKTAGKSSRFTSFFSQPQGDPRSRAEAPASTGPPTTMDGLEGAGSASFPPGFGALSGAPEEEKQAFNQLILKLQKASLSATPPSSSLFPAPPPQANAQLYDNKKNPMVSQESFHQYGGAAKEGPVTQPHSQQGHQEILAPRPQQQSARPEQLLQDLVGRHHQRVPSQGSAARVEPNVSRNHSNTEFLMNLMKTANGGRLEQDRGASQPQLGPLVQNHPAMASFSDRDHEFSGRDRRNNARSQGPPGFSMDEAFLAAERERETRPNQQPTQILQRPSPLGLDQMPPAWMTSGGQMPPPVPQQQQQQQQRSGHMHPPPGLLGGPGGPTRNMSMPPMFPPNFPPGGLPPPDVMGGMPPRNMPPPPPGFFNGPPHGFLPPGLGGFNGPPPGPEGFGGLPFEAQGMPPPNAGGPGPGRGGSYGR